MSPRPSSCSGLSAPAGAFAVVEHQNLVRVDLLRAAERSRSGLARVGTTFALPSHTPVTDRPTRSDEAAPANSRRISGPGPPASAAALAVGAGRGSVKGQRRCHPADRDQISQPGATAVGNSLRSASISGTQGLPAAAGTAEALATALDVAGRDSPRGSPSALRWGWCGRRG